jgi:hypothetical protein
VTAQMVRLGIAVGAMILAGFAFMSMAPSWTAWVAAIAIFLIGGAMAEAAFRRLASNETKRRDLEDRMRNPPS